MTAYCVIVVCNVCSTCTLIRVGIRVASFLTGELSTNRKLGYITGTDQLRACYHASLHSRASLLGASLPLVIRPRSPRERDRAWVLH